MYLRKDKMLLRVRKRNMEEIILLTPRAEQQEWQDMLPALEQPMEDTMMGACHDGAGCPLQPVDRTAL